MTEARATCDLKVFVQFASTTTGGRPITSAPTAVSVESNTAAEASTSLSFSKAAPVTPFGRIRHRRCWLTQLRAPHDPTRMPSLHWRAAGDCAFFTVVSCRVPDAAVGRAI